jgi:hypothetical protein
MISSLYDLWLPIVHSLWRPNGWQAVGPLIGVTRGEGTAYPSDTRGEGTAYPSDTRGTNVSQKQ